MDLILGFSSALLISIVLTPVFIRYAGSLKLIDKPTAVRHIHTDAIPRVGGLGIVIATFVSVGYWYRADGDIWLLFAGSAIIALFGYLDDRFQLNHRWKFFGQIVAVMLTLAGGVVIAVVPFFGLDAAPPWVIYPLSFAFILGVVNAVNLSDGMDGLAAGTILLSLGLVTVVRAAVGPVRGVADGLGGHGCGAGVLAL